MAEGLQRRIEYSDLKFISSFAMEKILDFQTWEVPGEHARGNFRLLLSENETGINSMDAPIQLLGQGNTAGALFSGYPEKVEIKEERGYRCRRHGPSVTSARTSNISAPSRRKTATTAASATCSG